MNQPRSSGFEANINVTPLVDVCLVLLIIFMIVMPVLVTGVPVHLPKTQTGRNVGDATRQLAITVKDDGTVYVDAIVLRKEQVATELRRFHDQMPNRPVAVRGD
ncbi:MAG TPA: biopolymer transporter ExbD, partial [Thermoanaerobaculia bacterium]|nr:biopolymer transporter ExbD [Thermoanaerobaculia bacterium]